MSTRVMPGDRFVCALNGLQVPVWDAGTRQELATLKGHTDHVFFVVFSPDGKTLASASADKTVRLWIAATSEEVLAAQSRQ